ncbi:MAG: DUF4827 domain-containing protein [Muribaculaceae bacterium]|nr:DUF4827 domain-containing protein [Muribaculaceae bacterium]
MKIKKYFGVVFSALLLLMGASCNDDVSYSDRLNTERHATNSYLANCRVVNEIPADSVFETGTNAPFYRIDPDGNVYMQVINPGDHKKDAARESENIYFRYTRYNLEYWYSTGTLSVYESNEGDMTAPSCSFKFKDFTLATSSQWGYGVQLPLNYLGAECEVNLIVKSQFGFLKEMASVTPFLMHVRYFHSRI